MSFVCNHFGALRALLCVILCLLIFSTKINEQKSNFDSALAMEEKFTIQYPENNCVYFPLIQQSVPEIDVPSGRWLYTFGQPFSVTYKYLDELNDTANRWRIAFAQGVFGWNSVDTPITLYLYSQSGNTISMVDDSVKPIGFAVLYVADGELFRVNIYGNYYWEGVYQWTDNQRQSIAAHEIGHLQGVGHIPRSYPIPSLMYESRTNEEREIYYLPQVPDIALVNQVYP